MAEEAGDVRARPTLSLRLRRKAQAQMRGREARGFGVGSGLGARGSGLRLSPWGEVSPGSRQGLVRACEERHICRDTSPIFCTLGRQLGTMPRSADALSSARADAPAYVCDCIAVPWPEPASFLAPLSRAAPESRWPAPPPMALPKVIASTGRSHASARKQPVPPADGSWPCRPRPHMISSEMTIRPRAWVRVTVVGER